MAMTKAARNQLEKIAQCVEFEAEMAEGGGRGGTGKIAVRLTVAQVKLLAKHIDKYLAAHDEEAPHAE